MVRVPRTRLGLLSLVVAYYWTGDLGLGTSGGLPWRHLCFYRGRRVDPGPECEVRFAGELRNVRDRGRANERRSRRFLSKVRSNDPGQKRGEGEEDTFSGEGHLKTKHSMHSTT